MRRYLEQTVIRDLTKKMVFITGPRQVGKTTLARQMLSAHANGHYLNFDNARDRSIINAQAWAPDAEMLVFDELHKMRRWKAWLKGVYDGKSTANQILVTGSARLDFLKKSGDSLAGRFFSLRLHPLSVAEWCQQKAATPEAALTHLLERGGYPEAALASTFEDSERWRRQYADGLIREDILEFSRLHEVNTMRLLLELLRERVASPLAVASLARDLGASGSTITRYLKILEALYIIFTVKPWHKNISRSLLKAPKVYFYDTGLVRGDEGVRFENLIAGHLLKWAHYQTDVFGKELDLFYLRTKDDAEVDFALADGRKLSHLIECKTTDLRPHAALRRFSAEHPEASAIQLVRHLRQASYHGNICVEPADQWLAKLI